MSELKLYQQNKAGLLKIQKWAADSGLHIPDAGEDMTL